MCATVQSYAAVVSLAGLNPSLIMSKSKSGCTTQWPYTAVVQEPEKLSSVLVADETESTYFVPETMSVWNVLEEVRRVECRYVLLYR